MQADRDKVMQMLMAARGGAAARGPRVGGGETMMGGGLDTRQTPEPQIPPGMGQPQPPTPPGAGNPMADALAGAQEAPTPVRGAPAPIDEQGSRGPNPGAPPMPPVGVPGPPGMDLGGNQNLLRAAAQRRMGGGMNRTSVQDPQDLVKNLVRKMMSRGSDPRQMA